MLRRGFEGRKKNKKKINKKDIFFKAVRYFYHAHEYRYTYLSHSEITKRCLDPIVGISLNERYFNDEC